MKQLSKRGKRLFTFFSVLALIFSVQFTALAASDPLAVVNNLSDFIFSSTIPDESYQQLPVCNSV